MFAVEPGWDMELYADPFEDTLPLDRTSPLLHAHDMRAHATHRGAETGGGGHDEQGK